MVGTLTTGELKKKKNSYILDPAMGPIRNGRKKEKRGRKKEGRKVPQEPVLNFVHILKEGYMPRLLIVGSGIVGQATGKGFMQHGIKDVCFSDINVSLLKHLQAEGLDTLLINGQKKKYPPADFVMVCISTPPGPDGGVNLCSIKQGMATVGEVVSQQKWPVVVIRSTVPPWTTEKSLVPLIEQYSGKTRNKDFGVTMNPEFLRAKSSEEDFAHPWATVIGEMNRKAGDLLEELYKPFGGQLFRMRIEEAEFLKYVHNLRNAAIISFNNEQWLLANKIGIKDPNKLLAIVTETAESAWNPKYGCAGGWPYGGPCLPKDTHAEKMFAEQMGVSMPLLSAIIAINDTMEQLAEDGKIPCAQIEGHNWMPSPALKKGGSGKNK